MGINSSEGKILFLLNPDAYVTKDSILELIKPLLNDKKIMITGPKIFYPGTKKIQSAGGVLDKNALSHHIGYGEEDGNFDVPKILLLHKFIKLN